MKAMIIVMQGLEECEALLTYDLLYRAGIEVDLVSDSDMVTSSRNVTFKPHRLLKDIDPDEYDCLILPGGIPGTNNLENSETVQNMIDDFVSKDKYIAAICAAPSILLHKGLLENGKFTCHPGFESGYEPLNEKAVMDGRFITGKGVGAVFEFAKLIITALLGEEKAEEIMRKTQYY